MELRELFGVLHLLGASQFPRLIERISNFKAIVDAREATNAAANHHRCANLRECQLKSSTLLVGSFREYKLWLRLSEETWIIVEVRRLDTVERACDRCVACWSCRRCFVNCKSNNHSTILKSFHVTYNANCVMYGVREGGAKPNAYRLVRALMKMVSLNSRRSFLNLFACQGKLLIYVQSAAKFIEDHNTIGNRIRSRALLIFLTFITFVLLSAWHLLPTCVVKHSTTKCFTALAHTRTVHWF